MATLPTTETYMSDLRTWMGTLVESDFDITLTSMGYADNATYFPTDADVYKHWSVFGSLGRNIPLHNGIRLPSARFVLSNIEDTSILFKVGDDLFEPNSSAFYTHWDYEGNPYKDNDALKRRCMVAVSVDMIMLDDYQEGGGANRSDFAGFNLAMYGYVYTYCNSVMTSTAKAAFLAGMVRMFNRIEGWGPNGINADMDQPAHLGMWYTGELNDDESLRIRAREYSKLVMDSHFSPAGYIDHGGGYDGSYMGISLVYLLWAYYVTGYGFIREAITAAYRLKTSMIFPDPNGVTFNSPSDFNTATAHGASNDQHNSYQKAVGYAMAIDEAKCIIFTGRDNLGFDPQGVKSTVATMKSDISTWVTSINTTQDWLVEDTTAAPTWAEKHWVEAPVIFPSYFRSSFWSELIAADANASDIKELPCKRTEDFVYNFNNEFLSFKFGRFAGIISTPPMPWWAEDLGIPGFVGGAVSAFWTLDGGSAILAKSRGYQGADADDWTNYRDWGVNHIWGTLTGGDKFSSARNNVRDVDYTEDGNKRGTVSIEGTFLGAANPDGGVTRGLRYHRIFDVDATGLTVSSAIYSDGVDDVSEMYETIPLYLRDSTDDATDATIRYHSGGSWSTLGTTFIQTRRIAHTRNDSTVIIEFDSKRWVRLTDNPWTTVYQEGAMRIQTIDIKIVTSAGTLPDYTRLQYKVTGPYNELSQFEIIQ